MIDEHATETQEREEEDLERAFREVLATAAGKRVIFWLLAQCDLYGDPFGGKNHAATNYGLGRQSVGRRLINMLDGIDPRAYPQMLLELADLRLEERVIQEKSQQENDDDLE